MALVDQMYTVGPETSVDDCMVLITGKRIRHLPVFDNDKFVGIIAIGNIVKSIIAERETLIDQLAFVSFFRHPAEDGGMFHSRCILVVAVAGDELKRGGVGYFHSTLPAHSHAALITSTAAISPASRIVSGKRRGSHPSTQEGRGCGLVLRSPYAFPDRHR